MSQIETLLLFVLGFSLATLIALFVSRMVWAAALKVGARRMQKQVPSSLVGLQTERDRLRAEYAMLSQRLSSKLETVKLRMAEQMAEVTRHRNRIEDMSQSLAARDAEIETLKHRLATATDELATAAALQDELRKALAVREADHAAARKELSALQVMYEALRDTAQNAATPAAEPAMEPRPTESGRAPAGEERLKRRIDKLSEMARSVARDRKAGILDDTVIIAPAPFDVTPADPLPVSDPLVAEKLGEAERETDDLRRELEQLDAEWEKRLAEPPRTVEPAASTPAVANVISLANRIRELKKGLTPT